jgi:hypothetical protein
LSTNPTPTNPTEKKGKKGEKKWHILTVKIDTGAEWSRIGARKAAQFRFAQFLDVVRIKTSRSRGVNDAVHAPSTSISSTVRF